MQQYVRSRVPVCPPGPLTPATWNRLSTPSEGTYQVYKPLDNTLVQRASTSLSSHHSTTSTMQPIQPGLWVKPDGSRVYMCNCRGPCDGQWNELKTSKQYQRHAKYRLTPEQFLLEQAQAAGGPAAGPLVPPPIVPPPVVYAAPPPGPLPAQARPAQHAVSLTACEPSVPLLTKYLIIIG